MPSGVDIKSYNGTINQHSNRTPLNTHVVNTYLDQESRTVGSHDMDGVLRKVEARCMLADKMQHLQSTQVADP
jgi:hypothetical protein